MKSLPIYLSLFSILSLTINTYAQVKFDFNNSTKLATDNNGENIAVGDLTGDGLNDIVVGSLNTDNVMWYSNKGNKVFQKESSISISGNNNSIPQILDVNKDGKNDILVSRSNSLHIMINNGDKTFTSAEIINTNASNEFSFADFNNDSKIDIAISTGILLGKGDGTFESIKAFPVLKAGKSFGVEVTDIDKDGNQDIAMTWVNLGNSYDMAILLGNGDGTFDNASYFDATPLSGDKPYIWKIRKGDFNKDGNVDFILGCGPEEENLIVYLGKGDGDFITRIDVKTDIDQNTNLAVADLNNDGYDDILTGTGKIYLIKGNNTGSFQADSTFTSNGYMEDILIADINGDNKKDLALLYPDDNGENAIIDIVYNSLLSSVKSIKANISQATLLQNPVQDFAQIKISNSTIKAVTLIDANGRLIICNSINISNNILSIDMSSLPKGMYFLLLYNGAIDSQHLKINKI